MLCTVHNYMPKIILTYRCIINGKIGEIGEDIKLPTLNDDYPVII